MAIKFFEGDAPKVPEKQDGAVDQKSDKPKDVTEVVKSEFKSEGAKAVLAKQMEELLVKGAKDFSPEFQKAYFDEKGQPRLDKIMAMVGLDQTLAGQFGADGKLRSDIKDGSYQPVLEISSAAPGKIPERPANALTGSQFIRAVDFGDMNSKENQYRMEQAILAEIAKGNIPSFCRPENMKTMSMKGNGLTVQYKAGLDYMAIGSDNDFIRVPMTPILAQALSEKYGWGLPTKEMTRAIYANSDRKLSGIGYVTAPEGTPENAEQQRKMQGNEYIARHTADINKQLGEDGLRRLREGKALVAGHKKDVIISRYAIDHPDSLDFDGLYIGGAPIQHNPAHESTYRDYSHAFRPIDGEVIVIDEETGKSESMAYYEALKKPRIAAVLNGAEGAIDADKAYQKGKEKFGTSKAHPKQKGSDKAA